MAAPSNNFIRVRLEFDYPPPALVDCRMCWLLVDRTTCRVVADLESLVREKFDFSRRSILNLFVESCYLPHTESIYVVRDNDSVRVKVEYLDVVNGDNRCSSKSPRKRRRPTEENEVSVGWKKKRRVEKQEAKQASVDKKKKRLKGKCKEKKKKKKTDKKDKSAAATSNTPVSVDKTVKTKKSPVAQPVSSSDSSSSSSEEEKVPQKAAPKTPSSAPASSRKQNQTKQRPPSSSSSETSSDEATTNKPPPQKQPPTPTTQNTGRAGRSQPAPPMESPGSCAQKQAPSTSEQPPKPCSSDSEEEIEFVIRKPVHPPGFGVGGPSWRGFGNRGKNGRGGSAQRGRGGHRGGFRGLNGSVEHDSNGAITPSYQTDSLTNTSLVLQNKTPKTPKDYSSMPLLAAPPQVGQKIVFKLLELTENYTPEVSDYKEGKMISFDHSTKQIELELQAVSHAPVEPGKFDLVYQNPDGTERVEYAVSRDVRVVERWDCLLEPRLMI